MNKVYFLFLVLFFCSFAVPVRGQKALDETIRKNFQLEKDIESLKKDSTEVKDAIKNKRFQIEKESIKKMELENTYNSKMRSTSQDTIMILRQLVDSLERQHSSLQASILSIKNEISEKNGELRNIDSELQNMNAYLELQKQQTYKNNKLYLDQKYSQMSWEELTDISNNTDEYQLFEDFPNYKKRIAAALNNKRVFDEAWDCVNLGNGYQKVDEHRSKIRPLLEIKKDDFRRGIFRLTEEQFNELDSLDIRLSRFNSGIKELKKIVEFVNSDEEVVQIRRERKNSSKKRCLDLMKRFIVPEKDSEQNKIDQRYFKMIPYLNKLLQNYWNELNRNPFDTPTKSESIITNLIVK